jgi:hypothetical protein
MPTQRCNPLEHNARRVNLHAIEVGGPEDRYRSDTSLSNIERVAARGWVDIHRNLDLERLESLHLTSSIDSDTQM